MPDFCQLILLHIWNFICILIDPDGHLRHFDTYLLGVFLLVRDNIRHSQLLFMHGLIETLPFVLLVSLLQGPAFRARQLVLAHLPQNKVPVHIQVVERGFDRS